MKKLFFAALLSAFSITTLAETATEPAGPTATIETSAGTIRIALDAKAAPVSVENFVRYARSGFYDQTIFHRVIEGFMIQGGGFDSAMTRKETEAPIRNEAGNGRANLAGTIAMARTQAPHSATAQFFINLVDNTGLDHVSGPNPEQPQRWGYAVFGKVVEGMDVVRKIGKTPTSTRGFQRDVPVEPILIEQVTIED